MHDKASPLPFFETIHITMKIAFLKMYNTSIKKETGLALHRKSREA